MRTLRYPEPMAHAGVERARSAAWSDRVFQTLPVAPIWVSVGLALTITCLFLASTWVSGDLEQFVQLDTPWWRHRDARMAVLFALLVSYLPAARRYQALGTQRDLRDLRASLPWDPARFAAASPASDPRGRRVAGLVGLLVLPVTALLVDRDPDLYFQRAYWNVTHFWTIGMGALLCWNGGVLIHAIFSHARGFSELARSIPRVDLLDLRPLAPFARQGMRAALPGVVFMSFLAFNLVDQGWLWAIAVLGVPAACWIAAALLIPLRGLRDRIREAKQSELARVNAAIRGQDRALADSPIAGRSPEPGLGELLAYREFVNAVPEWPFDAPMRARFVLYAALPIGSWLGGAIVERLLGAALG